MGIIRFALKSSIAGGVVYYTVQEGLWSKPEDTVKLYCKLYNGVTPYIREYLPQDLAKDLPYVPSISTLTGCSRGMWNSGVIKSIKFVSELPEHMSNGIDYLSSMPVFKESASNVKGLLDAQPESKKAQ